MLTTKFKNLRTEEDVTIAKFNPKLIGIANQRFQLGKKYPYMNLSRKTLRSLLKRFKVKMAAIEEVHDITPIRLDELMGLH